MAWPKDESKLNRVRSLMKDQEVSALVVRAPDNVLYLTNYWCMKGYDAVVFPKEGDPTLIALEPQQADAVRQDIRPLHVGLLINLGILYEDNNHYDEAHRCLDAVLKTNPNHERARMYMKDVESARSMYYDEDDRKGDALRA